MLKRFFRNSWLRPMSTFCFASGLALCSLTPVFGHGHNAYGTALAKDDAFMADAVADAKEIREITLDRKAREAGYYKTPESEKTANIAREQKYRSAELARASVQQSNAVRRMTPVFYSDISLGLLNGVTRTPYVNRYARRNGTYHPYYRSRSSVRW